MLKSSVFQFVFPVLCASASANPSLNSQTEKQPASANLPLSTSFGIDEHFQFVKEQVERRWQAFQNNREFKLFTAGKSDAHLEQEFENIYSTREFMWTTLGYDLAQHLLPEGLIRVPRCAAFAYNNTAPYYNASTMCLGGKYYIACEGPRSQDIFKFFNLLATHHITHLVRLTDSYEGEVEKCSPYWEGRMSASEGKAYLNVPTEAGVHSVRTFDMAYWKDNQGVDPDELLKLVLQVREETADAGDLLLVHCSAGVGRTGTFLAALAIVDAIDRGQPFSIEEIVYRLSLQRVYSVGKFGQYITLHRLAENYLNQQS